MEALQEQTGFCCLLASGQELPLHCLCSQTLQVRALREASVALVATDHTWPDAGISLLVLASPFHPALYIWNLVLSTSPQSPNQLPLWPLEPWKSQRRTDLALNFLSLLGVGTVPPGGGAMNGEEWPAYRHMVTQPAGLTTVLSRSQSVVLVEDRQELAPPAAGSSPAHQQG